MCSHVIVSLDGSGFGERALDTGAALAKRLGATLILTSAVASVNDETRRAYLGDLATRSGVSAEVHLFYWGRPSERLVHLARSHRPALICMASHARGALTQLMVGTVTGEVIEQRPGPVMIIGPEAAPLRIGPIVVALDGEQVAEDVLPLASAWAANLGVPVHLTQVDVKERWDSSYLERTAADLRDEGVDATFELLHGGHAAEALAKYAESAGSSAIAMTTHARTGVSRAALGSVTNATVRLAPCPVLAFRPLGVH